MKRFFLIVLAGICLNTGGFCQEEIGVEDMEVIEMLELLECIEMLDDEDFKLLENVTEIGDGDES